MVREGLRRTGYDEVALTSLSTADFSGIDGLVAGLVNDQEGCGNVEPVAPVAAGRRVHGGHRQRDPEGAPHRAHLRPRGRHVAHPSGDQQADHRRRPLRRGRGRLLAGLAAGEALLPHRPAHRDGRGHARHRRAGPRGRQDRPQVHQEGERHGLGRRLRAQGRTRRSSGSARTAPTSCAARSFLLRDDLRKSGATLRWHDPAGDLRRGHRQPGRPPHRPGDRARVAQRRHLPGVERALRPRPLDRCDGGRGARPRLVRHPPPHRGRSAPLGPHRRRPAPRLPLGRLAGRPPGARAPRLPVDAVLRLRGVHRLRPRTRGGVTGAARGREPGHRPGPRLRPRRSPSS